MQGPHLVKRNRLGPHLFRSTGGGFLRNSTRVLEFLKVVLCEKNIKSDSEFFDTFV